MKTRTPLSSSLINAQCMMLYTCNHIVPQVILTVIIECAFITCLPLSHFNCHHVYCYLMFTVITFAVVTFLLSSHVYCYHIFTVITYLPLSHVYYYHMFTVVTCIVISCLLLSHVYRYYMLTMISQPLNMSQSNTPHNLCTFLICFLEKNYIRWVGRKLRNIRRAQIKMNHWQEIKL